jgi:2-oxoglutarate dehydrogenase complex dehydrogenase (E1) component-like enzyme
MMGITDNDRVRLKNSFRKLFKDDYDLIDIDAEIDSSLSYDENLNFIKEKYDMMLESMNSYHAELEMYEKSLVDAIPVDDNDFNKMMHDIKSVMDSPGVKSNVKNRLIRDAIDKLSNLDHLKDQKKDKVSRMIKDYANKYQVVL